MMTMINTLYGGQYNLGKFSQPIVVVKAQPTAQQIQLQDLMLIKMLSGDKLKK